MGLGPASAVVTLSFLSSCLDILKASDFVLGGVTMMLKNLAPSCLVDVISTRS